MKPFLLLLVSLAFCATLFSQQTARIGEWQYYLSFNQVEYTTQSEESVFLSFTSGIVEVNKSDQSISYITKLNRLNDFGCYTIGWNNPTQSLVVTYDNGNIDILTPNGTTNEPAIKNSQNISGDRRVNGITMIESGAYLSTDFGLSKLDLIKREFEFTTFTNIPVNDFASFQGKFYMATDEGVYSVPSDNANPADFGNWQLLGEPQGLPGDYIAYSFSAEPDRLYIGTDFGIYDYSGAQATLSQAADGDLKPLFLESSSDNSLLVMMACPDNSCDPILIRNNQSDLDTIQSSNLCLGRPTSLTEDEKGNIWLGNLWEQIYRLQGNGVCTNFKLNTPESRDAFSVTLNDEEIYIAAGGIGPSELYTWNFKGVFKRQENGSWTSINQKSVPELDFVWDFVDVELDPITGSEYFATYSRGLVQKTADEVILFDKDNSSLGGALGDGTRTRVSSIAFDDAGNLWIGNFAADRSISVLTAEKEWKSIKPPFTPRDIMGITIDQQQNKWFFYARGNTPIIVYNSGDDIMDESDDQYRAISTSNSELPDNDVLSIAADLDGSIWVGTSDGVVVFDRCGDVFNDNCTGDRRIVEVDGIAAFLLESEFVNTIAIDGANRKWFGTNNGVFVQSADGIEQIHSFNVENSPLPDNVIRDITIKQNTGEVFIATASGLVSYQSDAVSGTIVNSSNIKVFPNPVRPEYEGPIAVRGVARDANVKITDIQGRLVYEDRANGGQFIWNGRDYNGRRVSSGVYLVFSTADRNITNPDAAIAKIVVIGQ